MATDADITLRERNRRNAVRRWSKPENVDKRVTTLAEHVRRVVDTFPPLSEAQQDKLRDAFRPALRPTEGGR